MPEWSNGSVSKTDVLATVPRVRIPVSPPLIIYQSKGIAMKIFSVFILSILAISLCLGVSRLTLKNGQTVDCEIVKYENNKFTIKKDGKTKELPASKIRKLEFNCTEQNDEVATRPAAEPEAAVPEFAGTFDIKELKKNFYDLDGKIIRLKFTKAYDVKQTEKGMYSIDLRYENEYLTIYFPKEGYSWFENLSDRGKGKKYVFGLIKSSGNGNVPMVLAFGRTRKSSMGKADSYSW